MYLLHMVAPPSKLQAPHPTSQLPHSYTGDMWFKGKKSLSSVTQLNMQLWLQWEEIMLKTKFPSKVWIIGTMKDTIEIIQHIQTYIDIDERRSSLEQHWNNPCSV